MKDINSTLLTAGPAAGLVIGTAALLIFQELSFAGMRMIAGRSCILVLSRSGSHKGPYQKCEGTYYDQRGGTVVLWSRCQSQIQKVKKTAEMKFHSTGAVCGS